MPPFKRGRQKFKWGCPPSIARRQLFRKRHFGIAKDKKAARDRCFFSCNRKFWEIPCYIKKALTCKRCALARRCRLSQAAARGVGMCQGTFILSKWENSYRSIPWKIWCSFKYFAMEFKTSLLFPLHSGAIRIDFGPSPLIRWITVSCGRIFKQSPISSRYSGSSSVWNLPDA